ncbi:MAG: nucleoside transporter C-terminal domain-containing protein [Planctomycetota bacterium]|nr:nucleoside transporter C-terminal domain-containing protein [Planctomycetota bacterium]
MERWISVSGLFVMILLAWLMSSDRRHVHRGLVLRGVLLQFLLGGVILWTPPGLKRPVGYWLSELITYLFAQLQTFVQAGSGFLFRLPAEPQSEQQSLQLLGSFAFGVLPTIIVFSALMSLFYYLGVMQWIIRGMAYVMQKVLGVSGAESLAAAANVFVGHTEAPLVVRPYISNMTGSELNALMVGGFATLSGGLLAAYADMNIDAGHLVTASVISAPAALVIAKILEPERNTPETLGKITVQVEKREINAIDAIANGASEGLKLALNVAAMLLAFLAIIAMADACLGWLGGMCGFVDEQGKPLWSFAAALGYLFAPLSWVMGIEAKDCLLAGQLLGMKTIANEFVAFQQMGQWIDPAGAGPTLSPRTQLIMTYALSGFSNLGAIGIQIGGIGALAPQRRGDLARFGLRAMLGGALACCMTACVAGALTSL